MKFSQKIKNIAVGLLMSASMLLGVAFLAPTPPVSAAACTDQSSILTFPNWYRGIYENNGDNCVLFPDSNINATWVIVTNVVEILLQVVGYVAVGFIIVGGFKYITSQGDAAGVKQAKDTITRAIVGLVISIVSVLILNLVVGIFGLRTDGTCSQIVDGPTKTVDKTGASTTTPPAGEQSDGCGTTKTTDKTGTSTTPGATP